MARSRNIKPGFFTNDVLGELPELTRLLFAGLWTICDKAGRVEDRPKKIRAEVLPYDQCDAGEMLDSLAEAGFIVRYTAEGVDVIQVLAWDKHQNPHIKEAASTLPALTEHQTSTVHEQCNAQPLPERAGLIPDSLSLDSLYSDSLNTDSLKGETAPAKRSPPTRKPSVAKPDDVTDQTWADWLTLRKAKKAPVTLTTVEGAADEATKAGMSLEAFLKVWCQRGSQGLQASWLQDSERGATSTPKAMPMSFAQRDRIEGMQRWEESCNRRHPDLPAEFSKFAQAANVIDITPNQARLSK